MAKRGLICATAGAAAVAAWAAAVDPRPANMVANCLLGWGLLWLAWIDWREMRLPDALTIPLLLCGLGVTLLTTPEELPSSILGVLAGYASFRLVSVLYRRMRGREGLGHGDAKLLAAGGAWLGWQALPSVILIAALLGLIAAVLIGRLRGARITGISVLPFGPAIAAAIWLCRLYGPLDL